MVELIQPSMVENRTLFLLIFFWGGGDVQWISFVVLLKCKQTFPICLLHFPSLVILTDWCECFHRFSLHPLLPNRCHVPTLILTFRQTVLLERLIIFLFEAAVATCPMADYLLTAGYHRSPPPPREGKARWKTPFSLSVNGRKSISRWGPWRGRCFNTHEWVLFMPPFPWTLCPGADAQPLDHLSFDNSNFLWQLTCKTQINR